MSVSIRLLLPSLLAMALAAVATAGVLRLEVPAGAIQAEPAGDGLRTVRTWSWGALVTAADLQPMVEGDGLVVPLNGDLTAHGPRDAAGTAPLTLLADGLVLTVDGDASFQSRDGETVIGPPCHPMDPRAAFGIALAMLILTALMIRQTRRSLAGR